MFEMKYVAALWEPGPKVGGRYEILVGVIEAPRKGILVVEGPWSTAALTGVLLRELVPDYRYIQEKLRLNIVEAYAITEMILAILGKDLKYGNLPEKWFGWVPDRFEWDGERIQL